MSDSQTDIESAAVVACAALDQLANELRRSGFNFEADYILSLENRVAELHAPKVL